MRTLKVNLLYECTAQCGHCRFGCEKTDHVSEPPDFATPYDTAKRLKERYGLDIAVILGGEPGLVFDGVAELLAGLADLGVMTRLETNAYWAADEATAAKYAARLKGTDTSVMLSLDGFHAPYVPLDSVVNAVNACAAAGVRFNLEMPYLDIETKSHEIDRLTVELFRRLSERVDCELPRYEGSIVFNGRAADRYGPLFSAGKGVPAEPCTAVPWWHNSEIATTDLLILEPGGYLTKGCGIAIGNVHDRSVEDIVDNYDAAAHPIFSVLMTEGPLGLARLAEPYGYRLREDYADKCHLCHEARQVLKLYYDDVLQPNQHYI